MKFSEVPTYGSILVSFLLVPWGLTYYIMQYGPPTGKGPGILIMALIILSPGFLMGGTALWLAAQG